MLTASGFPTLLTIHADAQTITGKWVSTQRLLDNGEAIRVLLDLHKSGAELSGTVTTIGHVYQFTGTISGSHFEPFSSPRDTKPRISGDIAGTESHVTRDKDYFTALPATAEGEYPAYTRIEPPALHDIPGNSLAQTPPMGWNSWNFFQD